MKFLELFMAIHSSMMLGILFLIWIEGKRIDRHEKIIIEILASLEREGLDQRRNPRRKTLLSVGKDHQHQIGEQSFPVRTEEEK